MIGQQKRTQTDFEANKGDEHLRNLIRQIREELQEGRIIMAWKRVGTLEDYLNGLNMFGEGFRS